MVCLFGLFGEYGDQCHLMLDDSDDLLVAHCQPHIDILILIQTAEGANDLPLDLDEVSTVPRTCLPIL